MSDRYAIEKASAFSRVQINGKDAYQITARKGSEFRTFFALQIDQQDVMTSFARDKNTFRRTGKMTIQDLVEAWKLDRKGEDTDSDSPGSALCILLHFV